MANLPNETDLEMDERAKRRASGIGVSYRKLFTALSAVIAAQNPLLALRIAEDWGSSSEAGAESDAEEPEDSDV